MRLQDIIEYLENNYDSATVVANGWYTSDSYRGYYKELAVEPADFSVTIGSMVDILKEAIGTTFRGYKGGKYTMNEDTVVFYAKYGQTGPKITKAFLKSYIIAGTSELSEY